MTIPAHFKLPTDPADAWLRRPAPVCKLVVQTAASMVEDAQEFTLSPDEAKAIEASQHPTLALHGAMQAFLHARAMEDFPFLMPAHYETRREQAWDICGAEIRAITEREYRAALAHRQENEQ